MVAGFLGRVARRLGGTSGTHDAPPAAHAVAPSGAIERAVALHTSGRLADARAAYLEIVAADDGNAVACCMLGALAHQQGDSESAVTWMTRALDIDPGYLVARSNLGLVYLGMGRLADAEGQLREALTLDPTSDGAHANLALPLLQRGDVEGAEAALVRALELNPANVEARNNLANLCKDSGRLDQADSHYRAALALRPQSASIWQNLAAVAIARGDWLAAASSYRQAIEVDAGAADAWRSLGHALARAGRLADAESACRRALALRPDWPDALVNLAAILKGQGDLDAAEAQCRRALALDSRHAGAWAQLGTLRQEQHDVADAEACYRRAITLDPALVGARYNLGALRLLDGRYAEGFELVESRFAAFPHLYSTGVRARLAREGRNRWQGEPLEGRHLLVWSEQGFGDTLMMLRFIPLLSRLGAGAVTLLCEEELRRIAGSIAGVDTVIVGEDDVDLPAFATHCPTMSLPYCLRADADRLPSTPYIAVPDEAKARWGARLPPSQTMRVGIAWAGSPTLRDDAQRSVPPADLAPLRRVDGIQWVSLQKGPAQAQVAQWNGPIVDMMDECRDFADTAALIANLDLVIAVDTAVLHLAGAMGKPVWLLNRAGSEWRWGRTQTASAWYASLRQFRQVETFAWRPVIDQVATELARRACGKTSCEDAT